MKYYSRKEAARLLGVTNWTLKSLIRDSLITETKHGIPEWSIRDFEESSPFS